MEFKIGEFVIFESVHNGQRFAARVLGCPSPRRYRVAILHGDVELTVAAGDLVHLGEDIRMMERERSALRWARPSPSGREGIFRTAPISTDDEERPHGWVTWVKA